MSDSSVPEPRPSPQPAGEPSDAERQAVIDRIQQALAEDAIEFAEIDERFSAVYDATTRAELEAVVTDLPEPRRLPPPAASRHVAPTSSFSLMGDVKIGGWISVESNLDLTNAFGDVVVDLSSADLPSGGVTVTARTLFGDVRVIVADGTRVQTQTVSILGDRKEVVTAGLPGAPLVRVKSFTVFGDTSVYSLSTVPVGALRRLWSALRNPSS